MDIDQTRDTAQDNQAREPARRRRALCNEMLQPVFREVEASLEKPLRVADLGRIVGLSLFHFSREFRRVTGQSPYAFILSRRIARGAHLLKTTDLPISEIAGRVGFKTHAHFTNAFAKTLGMTPRRYRLHSNAAVPLPFPMPDGLELEVGDDSRNHEQAVHPVHAKPNE
jgi:transcriptional regulator GlxA family with amidase domain